MSLWRQLRHLGAVKRVHAGSSVGLLLFGSVYSQRHAPGQGLSKYLYGVYLVKFNQQLNP